MQDLLKEPCWQLIIIGVKFTHSFLSNECFFFPHCTFLVFFLSLQRIHAMVPSSPRNLATVFSQ